MGQTFKTYLRNFLPGILILALHFVIISISKSDSALVDKYFQNGFFIFIRKGYDLTIGRIDFPFIYILLPALLLILALDIRYAIKFKQILKPVAYCFNFLAIFFVLFYGFWAYNYYASTLEDRLHIEAVSIDESYLKTELSILVLELNSERNAMAHDFYNDYEHLEIEDKVRPALQEFLSEYNYYTKSKARVKKLFPGSLMRLRTSGIYIPFVFEGHFDSSIHPIQWPFTIAHEMSHAYGVTDEKECNFLAYLVCADSANKLIRYSAKIAYYRYLAYALIKINKESFQDIKANLNKLVKADLIAINEAITRYPELMPKARDAIYDSYLKGHGIKEGIVSYDKMIELIAAWKNQEAHSSVR